MGFYLNKTLFYIFSNKCFENAPVNRNAQATATANVNNVANNTVDQALHLHLCGRGLLGEDKSPLCESGRGKSSRYASVCERWIQIPTNRRRSRLRRKQGAPLRSEPQVNQREPHRGSRPAGRRTGVAELPRLGPAAEQRTLQQ